MQEWKFTMIEEPLFSLAGASEFDLERTGGLHVAVDEAFSTAVRIQLDDTSWVDHVQGWHADRPANLQDQAVIPVLSLGATRRFLIRPEGGGPSTTIVAHGGDLVVMGGRCQKDYQHSVPKQKQPAGARLSLNFSTAVPAE
jgi:hypothetical protein